MTEHIGVTPEDVVKAAEEQGVTVAAAIVLTPDILDSNNWQGVIVPEVLSQAAKILDTWNQRKEAALNEETDNE